MSSASSAFDRRRFAAAQRRTSMAAACSLDVTAGPTRATITVGRHFDFVLQPVPEDLEAPLSGRAYHDAEDDNYVAACMYEAARGGGKRSRKPRVIENVGRTGPVAKRKSCLRKPAAKRRKFKAAKIVRFVDPATLPVDTDVDVDEIEGVPFAILSAAESLAEMKVGRAEI